MLDFSIVRPVVSITALAGVPVLLILACRGWDRQHRAALSQWRNGIGLTAVTLLALAWMWFAVGLADTSLTTRLGATFLDLSILAAVCTYVTIGFGFAWKGRCRLEVLAASVLMGLGWRFFGYS